MESPRKLLRRRAGKRGGRNGGRGFGARRAFRLARFAHGRTISDAKLNPETSLAEIIVLKSGDQYFLVTNRAATGASPTGNNSCNPCPAIPSRPSDLRGRLYAFDCHGQLQWPAAVTIQNQNLLLKPTAPSPRIDLGMSSVRSASQCPGTLSSEGVVRRQANGANDLSEGFYNPTGVFGLVGILE